jgi:transcription elongation factor GreA
MTTNSQVLLTPEGWRRLHDELSELHRLRAAALSASTNGERTSRPENRASPSEIEYLSHCIAELEYVHSQAVPAAPDEREPDIVGLGSEVEVRWEDHSREIYTIVGPPKAAPRLGRISYASPIGLALMGRRSGENITVVTEDRTSMILVVAVR